MATLYTHQNQNVLKTWALMATFLVLIILVGWIFSEAYGTPIILYGAVAVSIVMNIYSYWYSDKLVLKMTGAKPANRQEHFDLYTIVENLAITAGLPKPKVYIVTDPAPNAFATGRNAEHGVVCVTTGLMAILNKTELEGVIAHELSHIGNRDILVSTVAVVLAGFIAIISDFFLRSTMWGGNNDSKDNRFALILALVAAILAPLAATLIQLAISRKREFLADASGALLTRYPEGLANALQKISAANIPMQRANNATAHLFIANPFGKAGAKKFFVKLFMTHPPTEDRINALLSK
jgi:heat shock protein HtpX